MAKRISEQSTVVAVKEQVSTGLDGEAVILQLKQGIYYGLDSVGMRVWDMVRVPRKVSEIRDSLVKEYPVQPDRCRRDLLVLLGQLKEAGLIDVKG